MLKKRKNVTLNFKNRLQTLNKNVYQQYAANFMCLTCVSSNKGLC